MSSPAALSTFTLIPPGSGNLYYWDFNDTTTVEISATLPVTQTFVSPGTYTVGVRAVNLVSDLSNSSVIVVQDEVTGLAVR